MRDLCIHDDDLIVATHGRSFWILDDITPLRQISPSLARSNAYLFKPRAAYRVRRDTNTDTPLPPDEPAGENPPDGAIFDYFLAEAASGPVTLEIFDAQGKPVRRTSSTDPPESTEAELAKQLIPLYWVRLPRILSAKAGMHRWVWDLHYPAPESTKPEYPISAVPHDTPRHPLGPRALPGQYTVRLTVEGHTYAVPLTIKMDPRVKTPPAGLHQQFLMEMRIASLMTRSSRSVAEAGSVRDQLQKLAQGARGSVADSIRALEKKVTAVLGKSEDSFEPGLPELTLRRVNKDVETLYGEMDRADADPTPAQAKAAAQIERDFEAIRKRWDELKTDDLAALNHELRGATLSEVHPQARRETDGD
jgi:hypothetical protein